MAEFIASFKLSDSVLAILTVLAAFVSLFALLVGLFHMHRLKKVIDRVNVQTYELEKIISDLETHNVEPFPDNFKDIGILLSHCYRNTFVFGHKKRLEMFTDVVGYGILYKS